MEEKESHSKLNNLDYSELKLQKFLKLEDMNADESKIVLKWRLKMAKFGANFGDDSKLCPLCIDNQEESFKNCVENINECKYEDIFKTPTSEVAKFLKEIMKRRENL